MISLDMRTKICKEVFLIIFFSLFRPCLGKFIILLLLLSSELPKRTTRGEPGRIYRIAGKGLLVAARDRCLWIREAAFDDGTALRDAVSRYDRLATVREAALRVLGTG